MPLEQSLAEADQAEAVVQVNDKYRQQLEEAITSSEMRLIQYIPWMTTKEEGQEESLDLVKFLTELVPASVEKKDIFRDQEPTPLWNQLYSGIEQLLARCSQVEPADAQVKCMVAEIFEEARQYETNLLANTSRTKEIHQFFFEVAALLERKLKNEKAAGREEVLNRCFRGLSMLNDIVSSLEAVIKVSQFGYGTVSSRPESTVASSDHENEESDGEGVPDLYHPIDGVEDLVNLFRRSPFFENDDSEFYKINKMLGRVEYAASLLAFAFPFSNRESSDSSELGTSGDDSSGEVETSTKYAKQAQKTISSVRFIKSCYLLLSAGLVGRR